MLREQKAVSCLVMLTERQLSVVSLSGTLEGANSYQVSDNAETANSRHVSGNIERSNSPRFSEMEERMPISCLVIPRVLLRERTTVSCPAK